MRIEKVNENQIRCFLTREDLESRQLQLKELAYGTENAKKLFYELVERANRQYGFSVENMPVMVEAVPMFDDSLVLIITRVENPEELDTRFSSFAPSVKSGSAEADAPASSALGQLLDSIRSELGDEKKTSGKKRSAHSAAGARAEAFSGTSSGTKDSAPPAPEPQLYTFRSLLEASAAAAAAADFQGTSSLYRDPADSKYYLFLNPDPGMEKASSGRWLSSFSEFGTSEYMTPAREQHLREHCDVLCSGDAVQKLSALGQNE